MMFVLVFVFSGGAAARLLKRLEGGGGGGAAIGAANCSVAAALPAQGADAAARQRGRTHLAKCLAANTRLGLSVAQAEATAQVRV